MGCEECEKIRLEHPGALCGNCAGIVHTLYAEVARLEGLHEALLNTLAPSSSAWIKKVVKNARAAYEAKRIRGEKP